MDVPDGVTSRHESALGTWVRAWQRPGAPLRGLVAGYHGYEQRLARPARHRGIPGASVALVFGFGPPQTVSSPDAGTEPVTLGSFVAGLYDRHVLIDAPSYHGIQVDLGPVAAFRLLRRPLRELTGRTLPLHSVFGRHADRVVERLATAPSWPDRFRMLDRLLIANLHRGMLPRTEVHQAWRRIRATGGRVRVGALARELGWSERRLASQFGDQLGMSPKRMAGLVRFERAAALLARPDRPSLAEIAHRVGYYDQAHLTTEVRRFAGLTPRQLVGDRLPDQGGVFDLTGR
ncbi:helix-turn-helix domain-containing protein [Egicoccus sp. AB-alg2]|uniref:helix-turn-helix domain-containing protein n=1 Tax=Egicoccus sp. AB-alg2 TaxID=3242693 RepID=UPI00359EE493